MSTKAELQERVDELEAEVTDLTYDNNTYLDDISSLEDELRDAEERAETAYDEGYADGTQQALENAVKAVENLQ